MNNKQLKLAKLFAELECAEVVVDNGELYACSAPNPVRVLHGYFNPFKGQLQLAARDKYEVQINYFCGEVYISIDDDDGEINVLFNDKSIVGEAVIECILKYKGKL